MNEEVLLRIEKKLDMLLHLLEQLPEYQAAVYLSMREEVETGKLYGKKVSDLFTIIPPSQN